MINIEEALGKLELYILELEEKYIDSHQDPLENPDDYKFDIRSYCLLAHAAFEEFVAVSVKVSLVSPNTSLALFTSPSR